VQELQQEQADEIEALQCEWQESVAALPTFAEGEAGRQLLTVTAEIQKTTIEIQKVARASLSVAQRDEEEFDQSAVESERMQSGIIASLQNRILIMNTDRATALREAKDELGRYAEVLEEMEQQFLNQCARLCHRLQIAEQRYNTELSRIQETQKHKMQILKAKKKEATMKAAEAVRALHKLENNTDHAMTASIREMELLRLNGIKEPQIAPVAAEEVAEIEKLNARAEALAADKETKLGQLRELREANYQIKRELAKLEFELGVNRP
jgi:hypothetical protein